MIAAIALNASAMSFTWPEVTCEMKPWVYNWWMGSAVDEEGIEYQCVELKEKGFGGFHVIPIYGANGPGDCYRPMWKSLLSKEWIDAWNMAARSAEKHGLGIDLTMGSGWCFGGPWIDEAHAASSGMKVKRAGIGGTGYMLDPFDPEAMKIHVAVFDKWFGKNGKAMRPRAFYHDSYEYYGAEPKKGQDIDESQLACFSVWTDWCRKNGYLTRNQAHCAPSNWLDFYAIADIPETEMFGRKCRDILISKFASSAANVKGTKLVSAESCTWVDEHFRERPAEIKMFIDRLFLSGVNHVFYHGCCYSPKDAVWPGWCFYASLEMNPRNPIWREVSALNNYITRCQSIFQTWQSDNDLAVLWDPSSFRAKNAGKVVNMTIYNSKRWFYGEAIGTVAKKLYDDGYAFDYVSPRMVKAGLAAKYAEIIDPAAFKGVRKARRMPFGASSGLLALRLKKDGRTMYFVVNQGEKPVRIEAESAVAVMNPMDGFTGRLADAVVEPGHSLFVADAAGIRTSFVEETDRGLKPFVCGKWKVDAVCGGPKLPESRIIASPAGWHTWDDSFSGTMRYATTFDNPWEESGKPTSIPEFFTLDLGEVCEIARVKINGIDLGVKFMQPYVYTYGCALLKPKGNTLEIEVTNLGGNRLRWNDINKVNWKYFTDINIVGRNYKPLDASKYEVLESGLKGPLTWRLGR